MLKDENELKSVKSPPLEGGPQDGVEKRTKILTTIDSMPIHRKSTAYLPADKELRNRARALRKMGNRPEIVFWQQVHKRKFHNIDFDRQRVIGPYIVDFYVKGLGLIVEIDGSSHNGKEKYDERRENYLKKLGLNVWRTSSTEVMMDIDRVMNNLKNYIKKNYS